MSRNASRVLVVLLALFAVGFGLLAGVFFVAKWHYGAQLPPVATLRDIKLQVPLRVYTRDGKLIGEFGAERRAPMRYDQMPPRVVQAFLAAEDDRFFEHPGVDWHGLFRAGFKLITTGQKSQGGSTITMQLARNVFLTPERSFVRKFKEILLATRIEHEMSKQQILETYLNKIFLGQRAYGIGAAAQVYFGREAADLSWAQAAMLAGLPKAPSRDNPVVNPDRAKERRDYVLRRLRDLKKISELDYEAAIAEPVLVKFTLPSVDVDASYVAEMVRAEIVAKYGEDTVYTEGYRVTTTLDSKRQDAANRALRDALTAYDERHGWRGAEARLPDVLLAADAKAEGIDTYLDSRPNVSGLLPAAVVEFSDAGLKVLARGKGLVELAPEDFKWSGLSTKSKIQPKRGDIIRVRREGERWRLAQVPQVQGAFVSIDPNDGALQALVGGYDFLQNKYNRAIQARRQPGSGFKPFLYASAFNFGFTPASVVLDAPVVFDDENLESTWRPENSSGDFKGPMRLREALVQSRNLVSVRLLQAVGVDYARDYISRFGLAKDRMPRDLSMALGSGSYTPWEMARAYAVLANGGFLVEPYFITEIADSRGQTLFAAKPRRACTDCAADLVKTSSEGAAAAGTQPAPAASGEGLAPRAIDAPTIWMVDDILREVTIRGTASDARKLGRSDIAGKTGTTNDETDAWFDGFTPNLVAIAWVGFDQPTPLGRGEFGARAALPMWIDYMRTALKGQPEAARPRPEGLVAIRVDSRSGRLLDEGGEGGVVEYIPAGRLEKAQSDAQKAPREKSVNEDDLF